MRMQQEQGDINPLLVSLILAVVLLVAAISFGGWAFASRQDYKNNSDKKSLAAAAAAVKTAQAQDAAQYAEDQKKPLKNFSGPSQFGSASVQYPRTWSAYVIQGDTGGDAAPLNVWFQPDAVTNVNSTDTAFALRVEVLAQTYDQQLSNYLSATQDGSVTVQPYSLPKVPSVIGSRVDGQIAPNKQGSLIILPLRNLTLEVWTESNDYLSDFDNNILPNLSFSP